MAPRNNETNQETKLIFEQKKCKSKYKDLKTYIRPNHLKKCWKYNEHIMNVGRVQYHATRLIPSLRKTIYEDRFKTLGTALTERRQRGDWIQVNLKKSNF